MALLNLQVQLSKVRTKKPASAEATAASTAHPTGSGHQGHAFPGSAHPTGSGHQGHAFPGRSKRQGHAASAHMVRIKKPAATDAYPTGSGQRGHALPEQIDTSPFAGTSSRTNTNGAPGPPCSGNPCLRKGTRPEASSPSAAIEDAKACAASHGQTWRVSPYVCQYVIQHTAFTMTNSTYSVTGKCTHHAPTQLLAAIHSHRLSLLTHTNPPTPAINDG